MILARPEFVITRNDLQYINGSVVWYKLQNGNPWYCIEVQHCRKSFVAPHGPEPLATVNFPCLGGQPPATIAAFITALQMANAIAKALPKCVPLVETDGPDPEDAALWKCPDEFKQVEPVSTWKMLRLINLRNWKTWASDRRTLQRRAQMTGVGDWMQVSYDDDFGTDEDRTMRFRRVR